MGEEALPLEDYQESLPVHPSAQAAGRAPQFRGRRPTSVRASMAMKGNRSRGTEPELMLRRALWGLGLRYRLHAVDLPGKPDIVFRRQKVAVFVDGDFWHGRDWERLQTKLSRGANADYWVRKIEYNESVHENAGRNSPNKAGTSYAFGNQQCFTMLRKLSGLLVRYLNSVVTSRAMSCTQLLALMVAAGSKLPLLVPRTPANPTRCALWRQDRTPNPWFPSSPSPVTGLGGSLSPRAPFH